MSQNYDFISKNMPQIYQSDPKLEYLMHVATSIIIFSLIIFSTYILFRFLSIRCGTQTRRRNILDEIRHRNLREDQNELVLL